MVAFAVHGFQVEMKFEMLFYWGEVNWRTLWKNTEQGREATETHL